MNRAEINLMAAHNGDHQGFMNGVRLHSDRVTVATNSPGDCGEVAAGRTETVCGGSSKKNV